MANLHDIQGTQTLKEAWPKIEANEQSINAELIAHKNTDAAAHPAEKISYSGSVPGKSNIKDAVDETYEKIDYLIGQTAIDPGKDPEVLAARISAVKSKTFDTVGARLEEIEAETNSHLADIANILGTDYPAEPKANQIFFKIV